MICIVDEIFQRCDPTAIALVSDRIKLNFGELKRLVESASSVLETAGLGRSGHGEIRAIGLHCPNGVEHIFWSLAILRCNAALVPIAPELSHRERDDVVRTTGVKFVLCAGGNSWHMNKRPPRDLSVAHWRASWVDLSDDSETPYRLTDFSALNPALIRFSSGTTGQSKGVVLSHDTLLKRVTSCNAKLGIHPGDKVVWTLPMAHHFAVSIVLYLLHGATTVLAASHTAKDVQRAIATYGGTVLYSSPYHHALLASHPETTRTSTLRLAVSTAAPLRAEVAAKFENRLGIPLTQAMGIIEVGLPLINVDHASDKPCSVGRPQPDFACRIVDTAGRDTPACEPGELLLRGPGCFDAYLAPWATRDEVMHDGWFATGDIALADRDGDITLLGRTRAVINVAGMKVFPEEVETILLSHPSVAEVRVYGIPHDTYGSIPAAAIVAKNKGAPPSQHELEHLCREALAAHKIPRRFDLVDALPKTPNGKIRRY